MAKKAKIIREGVLRAEELNSFSRDARLGSSSNYGSSVEDAAFFDDVNTSQKALHEREILEQWESDVDDSSDGSYTGWDMTKDQAKSSAESSLQGRASMYFGYNDVLKEISKYTDGAKKYTESKSTLNDLIIQGEEDPTIVNSKEYIDSTQRAIENMSLFESDYHSLRSMMDKNGDRLVENLEEYSSGRLDHRTEKDLENKRANGLPIDWSSVNKNGMPTDWLAWAADKVKGEDVDELSDIDWGSTTRSMQEMKTALNGNNAFSVFTNPETFLPEDLSGDVDLKKVTTDINDLDATISSLNQLNEKRGSRLEGYSESPKLETSEKFKFESYKRITNPEGYDTFDRAMYSMPNAVGSMISMQQEGLEAGVVANIAYQGNKVLWKSKLTKTPWGKAAAITIGGVLAYEAIDKVKKQTSKEALMETNGSFQEKNTKDIQAKLGVDISNLSKEEYAQLKGIPVEDAPTLTKKQMMRDIFTNGSSSQELNEIVEQNRTGLKNVYDQNMSAVGASNMIGTALVAIPFGNVLMGTSSKVAKKVGTSTLKSTLYETITPQFIKTIKKGGEKAIRGNKYLAVTAPIVKGGAKVATNMFKEGVEEGAQFNITKNYVNQLPEEVKANSTFRNYVDGQLSMLHVGGVLSGISKDPVLTEDKEFWHNVEAGAGLGALFGSVNMINSTKEAISNYNRYLINNKYQDHFIRQLTNHDLYEKGRVYSQKAFSSKQSHVVDLLESYLENTPEGVTKEQVQKEIDFAKHVMTVSKSKAVSRSLKNLGYSKGSDQHLSFMGLYSMRRAEMNGSVELSNKNKSIANNILNSKDVTDAIQSEIGSKDLGFNDNVKEVVSLNARIEALDDTIKMLQNKFPGIEKNAIAERKLMIANAEALKKKLQTELKDKSKLKGQKFNKVVDLVENTGSVYADLKQAYNAQFLADSNVKFMQGSIATDETKITGSLMNLEGFENGTGEKMTDAQKIELKKIIESSDNNRKNETILDPEKDKNEDIVPDDVVTAKVEPEVQKEAAEDTTPAAQAEDTVEEVTEAKDTVDSAASAQAAADFGIKIPPKTEQKDIKTEAPVTDSATFEEAFEKISGESPTVEFGNTNTTFTKALKEDAVEGLLIKLRNISNAKTALPEETDNDILNDVANIIGYYLEGGVKTFSEACNNLLKDVGFDNLEILKPYLKEGYKKVYTTPALDSVRKDISTIQDVVKYDFLNLSIEKQADNANAPLGTPNTVETEQTAAESSRKEELSEQTDEVSKRESVEYRPTKEDARKESDKLSRVFFYDPITDTTPQSRVMGGYVVTMDGVRRPIKNGKALGEATQSPSFLKDHTFEYYTPSSIAEIEEAKKAAGSDNLDKIPVYVLITNKETGDVYATYLREPYKYNATTDELAQNDKYETYPDTAIQDLRDHRNAAIEALLQTKVNHSKTKVFTKVIPTEISLSNGKLDNGSSNRNLQEITGLKIPSNQFDITPQSVEIGICTSDFSNYTIETEKDTYAGIGTTAGAVYLMIPNASGRPIPTMLNPIRFSNFRKNGKNDVVDTIYQLAVVQKGSDIETHKYTDKDGNVIDTKITSSNILDFIVNFGIHTELREGQNPIMEARQFFVNENILHLGSETYDLNNITAEDESSIKSYIENVLHWNTSKGRMFEKLGSGFGFEQFFLSNQELDTLPIIPGVVEVTREQVGLEMMTTTTGRKTVGAIRGTDPKTNKTDNRTGGVYGMSWMVTNGMLQSKLKDNVLYAPFIFAHTPKVEDTTAVKIEYPKPTESVSKETTRKENKEIVEKAPVAKPTVENPENGVKETREEFITRITKKADGVSTRLADTVKRKPLDNKGRKAVQRGLKAVQRRLQDLREAASEKQIAQAITNIEKNVKRGAEITKEEQSFVNQKKQELKDKGFEIVDYTGKVWDVGMNLLVLNMKSLEEGVDLTQNEINTLENELENRKKKRKKLKEIGLSEQEIDNQLEDTISIMTTVQPQLNKDGEMVQSAKVDILMIEVSQAEEILERSKKNLKKPGAPSALVEQKQKADVLAEAMWLYDVLGLTESEVSVVHDLISVAGTNVKAMGMMHSDSIVLYSEMEEGTAYHEAFHRVSLLLLSPEERQKVYTQARKSVKSLKNASDKVVEEYLAEDFRNYVLSKRMNLKNATIGKVFRRIKDFIKNLFGLKTSDLNKLYNNIVAGNYKGAPINEESLVQFENEYSGYAAFKVRDRDFAGIANIKQYDEVVKSLGEFLLQLNNIADFDSVDNTISFKTLEKELENAIADKDVPKELKDTYVDVIRNIDIFTRDITSFLKTIGLSVEGDVIEEVKGAEDTLVTQIKDDNQISVINNASPEMKFFVGTIKKIKDGSEVLNRFTGLPEHVDYVGAWQMVFNLLHDVRTYEELLTRLTKASEGNSFYKSLLGKLEQKNDENFNTGFLKTVRKFKNSYNEMKIKKEMDGTVSYEFRDSDIQSAIKRYPGNWSIGFAKTPGLYEYKNGKLTFNVEIVDDILKDFDVIYDGLDSYKKNKSYQIIGIGDINTEEGLTNLKSELVSLLNRAGITVDSATIDSLVLDHQNKKNHRTYKDALIDYITSNKNFSVSKIFKNRLALLSAGKGEIKSKSDKVDAGRIYTNWNNGYIKILAEHYAKTHPDSYESKIIGADGNSRHEVSQNNFITDFFNDLQKDDSLLQELYKVPYVAGENGMGSMFLTQLNEMRDRSKTAIKTFINFIEEGVADNGRDYFDITPVEDYMTKLIALSQDLATLPTMADKKKYKMIKGFKFDHNPTTIVDGVYKYNAEKIQQFKQYFLSEVDAIRQGFAHLDKYKGVDDNKLVKNYHTGKNARNEGNGLRFRYIDGAVENDGNGNIKFTSFNKMLDDAKDVSEIPAILDYIVSIMDDSAINDLLNEVVKAELERATELGIIDYSSGPNIATNKLLPQDLIDASMDSYSEYGSSQTGLAIRNVIADNALNSMISTIEFEKLFSKDPAYYKNTDDKIKRLSGLLSTGENLRTDYPAGHEFANSKFTVLELNDNITVSPFYTELENTFKSYYSDLYKGTFKRDPSWTDAQYENAFNKAVDNTVKSKLKSITEVNQTDATVFITPQMYKSILSRMGEWTPGVEESFDKLMSGESINTKDLNLVMQPLKTMYFGGSFEQREQDDVDGNPILTNLDIPMFDKMAMFPLFPSLATGSLRALYNRMVDETNPIDMVAFESAVKVGGRESVNYFTNKEKTKITDLNNVPTHQQDFKYLRRQLLTDPHHEAGRSIGTQVMKVGLSNIIPSVSISNDLIGLPGQEFVSGAQIIEEYNGTIEALSDKGVVEIERELGAVKQEDGSYILDQSKLSNSLIESAQSSGMPYDVVQMLSLDEDGKFKMPLSSLANQRWIESRFISMIGNKTVDIETPGGSFVQMTPFGLEKIGESEAALQGYTINNGKRLNIKNDDGSMDCVISLNMFKDVIPKGLSFIDARAWLLERNLIGPEAKAVALGYRIPTQGLASIPVLRVADVVESVTGDTIILPDEFTAISGSDFDIDKLYLARYHYDKDGKKIQFNDSVELKNGKNKWQANSKKANVNRLLDIMISYVSDEVNTVDTKTSIDAHTAILKNKIVKDLDTSKVDKNKSKLFDVSPSFQLDKKTENAGGKGGIAPYALANTHHVYTQMTNINFVQNEVTKKYGLGSLGRVFGDDLYKILDWLSAMINAHVDMAKDAYITRININEYTHNMLNLLLRSGKGEASFYFLGQPILKKIASNGLLVNGRLGVEASKSKFELLKESFANSIESFVVGAANLAKTDAQKAKLSKLVKYNKATGKYNITLDNDINSAFILNTENPVQNEDGTITSDSVEFLKKQVNEKDSFDWYYNQLIIAKVFQDLSPFANDLAELVQSSQVDTKKYGNSFTALKMFKNIQDRVKYFSKSFENVEDLFNKTFLNRKMRNSVDFAKALFKNQMIQATDTFDMLHSSILSNNGSLYSRNDKLSNAVMNALNEQLRAEFWLDFANRKGIDVKSLFIGNNTMVDSIYTLKRDIRAGKYPELLEDGNISNKLLDMLNTKDTGIYTAMNDITNELDVNPQNQEVLEFLTFSALKESGTMFQEEMMSYFDELLTSEHSEIKEIAERLAVYAFYTSGGSTNFNSIFEFIPESFKKEIGYGSYFESQMVKFLSGDIEQNSIVESVYENSINTPIIDNVAAGSIQDAAFIGDVVRGTHFINFNQTYPLIFTHNGRSVGKNEAGQPLFKPYLKFKYTDANGNAQTQLYKLIALRVYVVGEKIVKKPVYQITGKKGYNKQGRIIKEYTEGRSFINSNNIDNNGVALNNDVFDAKSLREYAFDAIYGSKTEEAQNEQNIIRAQTQAKENILKYTNIEQIESYNVIDKMGKTLNIRSKKLVDYAKAIKESIETLGDYNYNVKEINNDSKFDDSQKQSIIEELTRAILEDENMNSDIREQAYSDNLKVESTINNSYESESFEDFMFEDTTLEQAENIRELINRDGSHLDIAEDGISETEWNNMSIEEKTNYINCK